MFSIANNKALRYGSALYKLYGAGGENRTRIACLEGRHISHYTTPANTRKLYQVLGYNRKHKRNTWLMFENIDDKTDHFHSSAYAKVANGASLGSHSTRSFEERSSMDLNRQNVQRYGASLIGQNHMRDTAHAADGNDPVADRTRMPVALPRRRVGAVGRGSVSPVAPRQSFREPGGRGYNPYA